MQIFDLIFFFLFCCFPFDGAFPCQARRENNDATTRIDRMRICSHEAHNYAPHVKNINHRHSVSLAQGKRVSHSSHFGFAVEYFFFYLFVFFLFFTSTKEKLCVECRRCWMAHMHAVTQFRRKNMREKCASAIEKEWPRWTIWR